MLSRFIIGLREVVTARLSSHDCQPHTRTERKLLLRLVCFCDTRKGGEKGRLDKRKINNKSHVRCGIISSTFFAFRYAFPFHRLCSAFCFGGITHKLCQLNYQNSWLLLSDFHNFKAISRRLRQDIYLLA